MRLTAVLLHSTCNNLCNGLFIQSSFLAPVGVTLTKHSVHYLVLYQFVL